MGAGAEPLNMWGVWGSLRSPAGCRARALLGVQGVQGVPQKQNEFKVLTLPKIAFSYQVSRVEKNSIND